MTGREPAGALERHQPTVAHLRERVHGPVVLWHLDEAGAPAAIAIHHILNTWYRPDAQLVLAVDPVPDWPTRRALQRFVEDLGLTNAWLVEEAAPGQLAAFADRALVVLTRVPQVDWDEAAGALALLIEQREAACASA